MRYKQENNMQSRILSVTFIRLLLKEMPRLFLVVSLLGSFSVPAMALGEALVNCSPSTTKPNFRIDIHKSDKPVGIYHYNARNYNFSGIMGGLFKCRKPFLNDIYLARSDRDGKILLKKRIYVGVRCPY